MSQGDSASSLSAMMPQMSPPTPIAGKQLDQSQKPLSSLKQASSTTKQMSKLILRTALEKANTAVSCDASNDVVGAIDAYSAAIVLLNRVMITVENESDKKRLQEIYNSYSERLRLLNELLLPLDSDDFSEYSDDEADDMIARTHDDKPKSVQLSSTVHGQQADNIKTNPESDRVDDSDPRLWLSQPAKRNFSTNRGTRSAQTTYTTLIRRMGSASSLESTFSSLETNSLGSPFRYDSEPSAWLPSRSTLRPLLSSTNSPLVANKEHLLTSNRHSLQGGTQSPQLPSPMTSDNTPQVPRIGKATSAVNQQNVDFEEINQKRRDVTATGLEARRPSVTIQDAKNGAALQRASSTSTASSTATSLESYPDGELNPTIAQAVSQEVPTKKIASALSLSSQTGCQPKPLPQTPSSHTHPVSTSPTPGRPQVSSSSPVIDSRQQTQPSRLSEEAPMPRNVVMHNVKKQDSQDSLVSQHRRPSTAFQPTGLASTRKKSLHRLSRVSMDGSASVRRTQSGHSAAPLFSLFMKDVVSPKPASTSSSSTSPTDYFGTSSTSEQDAYSLYASAITISKKTDYIENNGPLCVILALEKSMEYGAHITPRLYIPKDMWQQPSVRLPSIETKLAACESLFADLSRLESWKSLDDIVGSLKLLGALEEAIESLQASLSKKLKRESVDSTHSSQSISSISTKDLGSLHESSSISKKSQSFMSWGSKLSKSVERMNTFSLTKSEDQYRNYIETLRRLFVKVNVLSIWWKHYTEVKKNDTDGLNVGCDAVLQKLVRVCDLLDTVVGGFVIRDMTVILIKWLKRTGAWVNE